MYSIVYWIPSLSVKGPWGVRDIRLVYPMLVVIKLEMEDERAKRVTIDLDEVIIRSDGSRATMREFVKEMLFYNPNFLIEISPDGETWYLRKRQEEG